MYCEKQALDTNYINIAWTVIRILSVLLSTVGVS